MRRLCLWAAAPACTLWPMWWILLHTALAGDIYQAETPDGTLIFTDSPPHGGYSLVRGAGEVPTAAELRLRSFPRMDNWDAEIAEAAQRYNVPAELIKAVMLAESGMNPKAESEVGAMGLMQLMPRTAASLGVEDPWDPLQNLDGGTRYIREQLDRFGDVTRTLAAYHAGPHNVLRFGGIPPFPATRAYVSRVTDLYEFFRSERPVAQPLPARIGFVSTVSTGRAAAPPGEATPTLGLDESTP